MIRLAVRVRREEAELVLAELLELAPSGVEEVDLDETTTEYAVYGAPGELPALPTLRAAAGAAVVEIETTTVADDWSERWRAYHRPITIGHRLAVRPPWEPAQRTELEIVIDPGQAFGTGAHATTRLCLELMLELSAPKTSFVDLGAGSGVLAIAAAKLGWAPVTALDNDPASVDAARANARANGVTLAVERLDLRTDAVPAAATVAANLLAPLLLAWTPRIPPDTATVVAGGILVAETDTVAQAFAARGLHESARRQRGDWSALLLEREHSDSPVDNWVSPNLGHGADEGGGLGGHPSPRRCIRECVKEVNLGA
jgi:ribosomal protein L11 methyltransferase